MSLFGNYDTPGRGVLKTPHEKKGFFKFWEIYGRHMWKLMELNFLYFLFCLPLFVMIVMLMATQSFVWLLLAVPSVIAGPATAAATRVARNFSQERHAFVGHDFMKAFKKNLKQGLIMGTVDTVFILWIIIGLPIYKIQSEQNSMMYIPFVISLACVLLFTLMHFYIYQMMCSTNLNMKQILKNSMFLVSLGIKESVWTFLATFIVVMVMYLFMPYTFILIPIWPLTFIIFVGCFNCYPVIRKHVIQPYYDQRGETNPELAAYESDPDDAIFEDKAAEEKPVPAARSRTKKKTIK
ncbi:MAG: DUF624 domain-containing protein [Ruminococcus sp.]|nr:DUF624 domain-containing protein [Ruminococcus sp.]